MKTLLRPLIWLIDKLSRKYLVDADKCMREAMEAVDREDKIKQGHKTVSYDCSDSCKKKYKKYDRQ